MLQRWLVAVVGLPLLLAVLLFAPPWATMLLLCAVAGVAAYELLHVAGRSVSGTVYALTIFCAVAQVVAIYDYGLRYTRLPLLNAAVAMAELLLFPWGLTVLLFLFAVVSYGKPQALSFPTLAAALVGGALFPTMYATIPLLRLHEVYGRLYALAPFFIAIAGDSLAMYAGKWFGRKKLTPVSPKKTWAGFFGSVLGSVLGMVLFGLVGERWFAYRIDWLNLVLVGVAGNLIGQLGDLSTSLIKREAGVKDYSHLFLTHGGVLDRFDSTLFIAPLVYLAVSAGLL